MSIPRDLPFDESEFRTRLESVQRSMAERGVDALLLFGPHNIYYLSGLDGEAPFGTQSLVVPASGEPTLVLFEYEVGRAANSSWLDDVVTFPGRRSRSEGPSHVPWSHEGTGDDDLLEATLEVIKDRHLDRSHIGIEQPGWGISPAAFARFVSSLGGSRIEDAFGVVEGVRLIKSPAELSYMRAAASLTELGIAAGFEAARHGGTDRDVAAAVMATLYSSGSDLVCWGPIVAAGYRAGTPHSSFNGHAVGKGESLFLEITGQVHRYTAPLMRTAILGNLTPEMSRIADAVDGAIATIVRLANPGTPAQEVAQAAISVLTPVLGDLFFHGTCGYPVGIGYPPTWSESLGFLIQPGNSRPLLPGMTFHLPLAIRKYGEFGMCQSQTIVITENGAEALSHSATRPVLLS